MSFQNLMLLQNLYRLKMIGFEYCEHFSINEKNPDTKPNDLKELNQTIKSCHLCDLNKSRTQSMSGFGNENADLMFIDFSVSSNEDNLNSYYVGRSGESLIKMCQNVLETDINETYFTHCVKCKPLNLSTPSPSECKSCKPYLLWQIEFINPKVIVTLGQDSYENLTGDVGNFESVRGHVIEFKNSKLIPIYHPGFLLRNPELKKVTLNDLKTIKSYL
jgi:DNA polymerase